MKKSWPAWRYLWKSEDIRRKLLITLGILVIYRFAANVPVPGINYGVLQQLQAQLAQSGGTFFQFLDLLSGGTVSNFSLLAMGVYPYITAQIILQLMVPIIPALQQMQQENPAEARKWMEKWTMILTIPMATLSALGQISIFNSLGRDFGQVVPFGFTQDTILPSLSILAAMVAGTMFAIWLGELISEFGIRNQGLSLIIFAGIVARIPNNFRGLLSVPTVFVYDGHAGGVGITERGFESFAGWAADTARLLAGCPCASGCPSCVQSPKCGNLNEMLDKAAAALLLDRMSSS